MTRYIQRNLKLLMVRGLNIRFFKDFITLAGAEVIGKFAGVLAFAYLARVTDVEDYGAVELAISLSLILSLIIDFGMGSIGAQEIARNPANTALLAAQISSARFLLALVTIPLLLVSAPMIGKTPQSVALIQLFALSVFASVWGQHWLFQGLEKMYAAAAAQAIKMIIFLIGIIIWVHNSDDIYAVGLIEIIAAASMAGYLLRTQQINGIPIRLTPDISALLKLIRKALPIGGSQVFSIVNIYLPLMLIAYFLEGSELAWFGAANRIVLSIGTFSIIYHFNLFPVILRRLCESTEALLQLLRPSFRVTAWLSVFGALVTTQLSIPLCQLIFGETFAPASLPLAILIWSIPVTVSSGHAYWTLIAGGHRRYVMFAHATGVLTSLAMGIILIPNFGAIGASTTAVLSSLVIWFVSHYYASTLVCSLSIIRFSVYPVLAAIGAFWISVPVADSFVTATMISSVIFAVIAPIVDAELIPDFRRLAAARSG